MEKQTIRIAAAALLGAVATLGILKAAEQDADGLFNFTGGEVLSASDMNANFRLLMDRIKALEASQPPVGAILAFAGPCPSGWLPADGSNGTPDLRGVFLRGLNNFGLNADGQGLNAAGTRDPDTRTAGAFQDFQVGPHGHASNGPLFVTTPLGISEHTTGLSGGLSFTDAGASGISRTGGVQSNGGVESRPRNVAVYFCVKQ